MNIVEIIRAETWAFRDRVAIVEGMRCVTYAELLEGVQMLCRWLAERSIGPGQRIAFRCSDGIDYVIGSLALLGTGAAVVPLGDSLTESEIRQTLEMIDVHGTLVHRDLSGMPGKDNEVFIWQPRGARGEMDGRCREMGAAFIRFSSGTTGASKGVVLSHRSIRERTDAANRGLEISENDVILWVLGMSHHFVVSILLFLRKGATIVVANRDFPFSVIETLAKVRATFIYASPVHYHLLAMAESVTANMLKDVRLAISTAMKMPRDISAAFAGKFGFAPAEAYGIIEIGLPFINREIGTGGENTVGRILPDYELQIQNRDVADVGEVLIRGPGMFDAYFSPWRDRAACLSDGWFHTGDLGRLDEQKRLCLLGRCKTVIVCAGMKIFPEEVEEVINGCDEVAESLVSGQEHPQFGQVPVARVVLRSGIRLEEQWIERIRQKCCQTLSSYKVPVQFEAVESLPRTTSGKLARRGRITE